MSQSSGTLLNDFIEGCNNGQDLSYPLRMSCLLLFVGRYAKLKVGLRWGRSG